MNFDVVTFYNTFMGHKPAPTKDSSAWVACVNHANAVKYLIERRVGQLDYNANKTLRVFGDGSDTLDIGFRTVNNITKIEFKPANEPFIDDNPLEEVETWVENWVEIPADSYVKVTTNHVKRLYHVPSDIVFDDSDPQTTWPIDSNDKEGNIRLTCQVGYATFADLPEYIKVGWMRIVKASIDSSGQVVNTTAPNDMTPAHLDLSMMVAKTFPPISANVGGFCP